MLTSKLPAYRLGVAKGSSPQSDAFSWAKQAPLARVEVNSDDRVIAWNEG